MRKPSTCCGDSNNKEEAKVNDTDETQGGGTGRSALQYFQHGHGGHGKGCSCREVKSCKLLQQWCTITGTPNVSCKRRKRRTRPTTKLFREDEEDLIIKLHALLGNRWSLIAGRLPGRTDNEVEKYWNTHVRRKLLSFGIDPDNRRRRHNLTSRQHVNPHHWLTDDVASSNNSTAQAADAISFSRDNRINAHCHPLVPADLNLDLTLTIVPCSPSASSSSSSSLVCSRMLEAEQQQFDQLKLREKNIEIASPDTLLLFR